MKVILRTHAVQEARIIVGYLNAHGVDAALLDGEISTMLPVVGGVRVAIDEEQEPLARRLLKERGVEMEIDPSP